MTNANDDAEPSGASAGSHGPVSVSAYLDRSACDFPDSRPLRRPRLLTSDEEEAIRAALGWLLWCEQNGQIGDGGRKDIATLRALLERLG